MIFFLKSILVFLSADAMTLISVQVTFEHQTVRSFPETANSVDCDLT